MTETTTSIDTTGSDYIVCPCGSLGHHNGWSRLTVRGKTVVYRPAKISKKKT